MAGNGPPPKDPSKRARKNADIVPIRRVEIQPAMQPALVEAIGELNPATDAPWTSGTLLLWDALGEIPTTSNLVTAQWLLLARAMILDDALLSGSMSAAAEARLQLAKFGIAPDDVARLRYQFALADDMEQKSVKRAPASRDRFVGMTVAPDSIVSA